MNKIRLVFIVSIIILCLQILKYWGDYGWCSGLLNPYFSIPEEVESFCVGISYYPLLLVSVATVWLLYENRDLLG